MDDCLPVGLNPQALEFPHFPTLQQAIVWRNWELVPVNKIALVLETNESKVLDIAKGMGLRIPPQTSGHWLSLGYITIIRANWHLLPYEKILLLLGWTCEKLAYTLKEDDFLWYKLGGLKPNVKTVSFSPLSEDEKARTDEIQKIMQENFPGALQCSSVLPFDFLDSMKEKQGLPLCGDFSCKDTDVIIDGSWTVSYPDNAKHAGLFAEKFIGNMRQTWGIELSAVKVPLPEKSITLFIENDAELLPESHSIEIAGNNIKIKAVDEVGLLRGLQWLEGAMGRKGGPAVEAGTVKRKTRFDKRLIYSYFGVYGDPLLECDAEPYPEWLLSKLSHMGVNGIWLQGILYKLVPWEEEPELSLNWELRINNLKKLADRAAKYGIGVYLYLNEPRAMPLDFFKRHPDWQGYTNGNFAALCTSQKPVRDFLRKSTAALFEKVPELTGIITITMSENITNCYSHAGGGKTNCPRCAERLPQEVVSEVNRLIADGAREVKPDAKILCWTWGWDEAFGWGPETIADAIGLLPENVSVMCTSEDEIPTDIAGVKGKVRDYSISIVGPGEKSSDIWKLANKKGLSATAKVQFNNSWECSAVPYLPVFNLVESHLKNLVNNGVTGLMLGWTLGGYPSLTLDMAQQYYWSTENDIPVSCPALAAEWFGKDAAPKVIEAWERFSEAFKSFPFDLGVLYAAPQNFGPMNLLYGKPTGYNATMIGFPYDDLQTWRGIYPADVFEEQFKKLSTGWRAGVDSLSEAKGCVEEGKQRRFYELMLVSEAVYFHFRSTYLQICFVRMRDLLAQTSDTAKCKEIKDDIIKIIDEERKIAISMHGIISSDSRIGYEASNHYYYTAQDLKEKVINCEYLRNFYL